jgi:hypothetical protein
VDTFKRAVKKIDEGGEIEATLNEFLMCYRSTPCYSAPEGKSPAEAMFGRKMRNIMDLLKPSSFVKPQPTKQNLRQNRQFDLKHGAKPREFEQFDDVYVKVHRNNKWQWVPGHICDRQGSVYYIVRLESQRRFVLKAHINQLRARYDDDAPNVQPTAPLPIDVLLDEFNIRSQPSDGPSLSETIEMQPVPVQPPVVVVPQRLRRPDPPVPNQPVRRSTRNVVRPSRFADYRA